MLGLQLAEFPVGIFWGVWYHLQVVFWRLYPKIIGADSDGKNKAKQEFGKKKHSWKDVNNLRTVMKWNVHKKRGGDIDSSPLFGGYGCLHIPGRETAGWERPIYTMKSYLCLSSVIMLKAY